MLTISGDVVAIQRDDVTVSASRTQWPEDAKTGRLVISAGGVTVAACGLTLEQLSELRRQIAALESEIDREIRRKRRERCLAEPPCDGSIVEHVTGGHRGRVAGRYVSLTYAAARPYSVEWSRGTWMLVAAADADGIVDAEPAEATTSVQP